MTLYLTDRTDAREIALAKASGIVHAVKYYPAGATTNADSGVTALERAFPALAAMEQHGIVLSVHGEVTDPTWTCSTASGCSSSAARAHRARLSGVEGRARARHDARGRAIRARRAGERRRDDHTAASRSIRATRCSSAACGRICIACRSSSARRIGRRFSTPRVSGNPKFFLGTDSAPHARHTKEHACGCAGCYSAPVALELYAEAFESAGALDRLEAFASRFGADFYGLPRTRHGDPRARGLARAGRIPFGADTIVPLRAGNGAGLEGRGLKPSSATLGATSRRAMLTLEASQTVAARASGGRKVRAPQSGMLGNAQTL